ncbi:SCO family protein [Bacillus sp. 31A1R]|uniref:SCO family protein n=1 Tax=Robertmurraya mangrovi TaxID=3098077 RepID=A0ABU5J572_9BACI|nr:SCO family protein [Bacillus sp. 31A1R]MDZ5474518.1 SCO family protein [Bacillus sp. 31A1R]
MKKIYLICSIIVFAGIAAGISFFLVRDANATIPEDTKLVTMNNEVYDFSKTKKNLKLVEFMYTHCPDICPTTTMKMNLLKKDLEKEGVFGSDIQFLSVTIDPYRDTPEVLKKHMEHFEIVEDGNWLFLTGDHNQLKKDMKQIEELAGTFQFQYRDPGDGFYVHSTFVFLVDENNKFIKKFPMGEDFNREEVFSKIMKELE